MAYTIKTSEYHQDIIIGGYGRRKGMGAPSYAGPLGGNWEHDQKGYFQQCPNTSLVDIEYTATDGSKIQVYQVRKLDVQLVDNSLEMVPPSHIRWFNTKKPEGIIFSNSKGRGGSEKYTGGLNAGYDDQSTSFFDERRGIIITYGAAWRYRHLGIIPTIFHEIGHVLTHNGSISYRPFGASRRTLLRNTRVSENPGPMEALCNTYMYFICYGSNNPPVRNFGRGSNPQKDRVTREALRKCRAFSTMLSGVWRTRFRER